MKTAVATYRMHPNAPAVIITDPRWFGECREYAINRESLIVAIRNIETQRDMYCTQEAYDCALSVKKGALAYLDAHILGR